jgi:hypothetical protein
MAIKTIDLQKTPDGERTAVVIKVRVTGFAVEPAEDGFRIDLAEDVETIGPNGQKIPNLSRMGLQTLQTRMTDRATPAEFTNNITFGSAPPGLYVVKLTIRDLIGNNLKTHEVPFELP